jgi:hypothetical protein
MIRPKGSMVGIVGAGIVFDGVDAVDANTADGTPGQVVEVHNQVGGPAAHLLVNFLGLKDFDPERIASGSVSLESFSVSSSRRASYSPW